MTNIKVQNNVFSFQHENLSSSKLAQKEPPGEEREVRVAVRDLAKRFSSLKEEEAEEPPSGERELPSISPLPPLARKEKSLGMKLLTMLKLAFAYIEFYLRSKYFSNCDLLLDKLYAIRDRMLRGDQIDLELFKAVINNIKGEQQNGELIKIVITLLADESNITEKQREEVNLYLEVGNFYKALDVLHESVESNNPLKNENESANSLLSMLLRQGFITEGEKVKLWGYYKLDQKKFFTEIKSTLKEKVKEESPDNFLRNLFINEVIEEIKAIGSVKNMTSALSPLLYIDDFSQRLEAVCDLKEEKERDEKLKEIKCEFALGFRTGFWDGNISKHFPLLYANYLGGMEKILQGQNSETANRHNATIYTCSFGSGHQRTAEAVASYIKESWTSKIIDLPEDTFSHTDNFRKILGVKDSTLFNKILETSQYKLYNLSIEFKKILNRIEGVKTAPGVIEQNTPITDKKKIALLQNLLVNRPDVIVTTYHMQLNPILELAEQLGIPVAHVSTDMNPKMGELFPDNPPTHPNFKLLIPMENEWIREKSSPLNDSQIEVCGPPIRREFYELKDEDVRDFRTERGIEKGTQVIFTMGGGVGQKLPFPELLANDPSYKSEKKIHLIVAAGNNNAFAEELLNNLEPVNREGRHILLKGENENVTIELLQDEEPKDPEHPYCAGGREIARAIGAADKCLIKPGGLSVFESLFLGSTIIADARAGWLPWEKENIHEVVIPQGWGKALEDIEELPDIIGEPYPEEKEKRSFAHFPTRIVEVIDDLYQRSHPLIEV